MRNNLTHGFLLEASARSVLRTGLGSLAHSALVLAGSLMLTSAGMAAPSFSTSAGNKTVSEGTAAASNTVKWVIADPAPVATYEMTVRVLDKDLNLAPVGFTINLIGSLTGLQAGTADSSNHIRTRTTLANLNGYLNNAQVTMPTDFWTIAATRELKILVSVDTNLDGDYTNDPLVETIDIAVTNVNDTPSITTAATVLTFTEDQGSGSPITISDWITASSAGGGSYPDPETPLITLTRGTGGPAFPVGLFSSAPALTAGSSAGKFDLVFTLAADANTAAFPLRATINDSIAPVVNGTDRNFTVTAVNDEPELAALATPSAVAEDAGAQTVLAFIDIPNVNRGGTLLNEQAQTLTFTVTNNNNALFTTQPAISGTTGNLTFTPAVNAHGSALVTVIPVDSGINTAPNDNTGIAQTFTITVNPVNDNPSYVLGTDVTVNEDSGAFPATVKATAILPGGGVGSFKETSDLLSFEFTPTAGTVGGVVQSSPNFGAPSLFSVAPAINATTGELTFTPAPNANGSITYSVLVRDNGTGDLASVADTIIINVSAVNDQPSITQVFSNVTLNEDSTAYTTIIAGPTGTGLGFLTTALVDRGANNDPNEAAQTLTYTVTNTNTALFSIDPVISAAGNLTFTLTADAYGSATVSVVPVDSGSNTAPNDSTGAAVTFDITVNSINDEPVLGSLTSPPAVNEDAGPQTITKYINTGGTVDLTFTNSAVINRGKPDESAQTITAFNVTNNTNPGLFSLPPAISASGDLTFTSALDANGTATISVVPVDSGSNTAPNDNTGSLARTFTITVNARNDAPFFTAPLPILTVTRDEDTPAVVNLPFMDATYRAGIERGGGADEDGQTLTFTASIPVDSERVLFNAGSVSINANGELSFTPRADAFGTANVVVSMTDSGSTVNGTNVGSNTRTFQIILTPVNDTPSYTFVSPRTQTVLEDAGLIGVDGYIAAAFGGGTSGTGLSGPSVPYDFRETSDSFEFEVTQVGISTGNLAFTTPPWIAPNGKLTYQTAQDTNGSATFTVSVKDTPPGGTIGGQKTGGATGGGNTFTINITAVNDAPIAAMNPFAPESEVHPTFGTIPVVRVVEDAPAYITLTEPFVYVADGPVTATDETTPASAQTISASDPWVIVAGSNSNPALFSVQPDVNVAGKLLFTVAANMSGSCTVQLQARDSGAGNTNGTPDANGNTRGSNPLTVKIIVEKFNDGPTLTPNATALTINEIAEIDEAAPPTITLNNWITALTTGPGTDPADYPSDAITNIEFRSTTNSAYFYQQPQIVYDAMNPTASTLTFALAADRFGTAAMTVRIYDDGLSGPRTVNGVTSTDVNFRDVTVNVVIRNINDAPFLSPNTGLPVVVNEDAHNTTQYNVVWVTPNDGPFESAQIGSFVLTPLTITPNLSFTQNPAINGSNGRLTFKTTPNAYGTVTYSVLFNDNGALTLDPLSGPLTVDGGTLTITVNPLNDAPVLTLGASQTINEDEGVQTVNGFLTGLLPGPLNELDPPEEQTMTVVVTNNANALFDVQPDITLSALPGPQTGVLTYTPKANAKGLVTVTVTVTDNGPNGGGNVNSTAPTFQILINVLPEISTVAATPTATTDTTEVRQARATLRGALTPEGVYAAAMFQYGITSDLTGTDTLETPVSLTSSAAGDLPAFVSVSQLVTNLLPGTQYYYRAIATNEYGTVTAGTIETFTTLQPMWTWVGGSTGANSSGIPLGIGISDASSTPPSRQGAGSWTSGGKHYILGGVSPSSTGNKRNDLWEYDPATSLWIWRAGSVTENASSVYGTPGAFTAGATPGARHTMMCWVSPTTGNLFLFGGFSPYGRCNDLWEYSVSLNQWKWINTAGTPSVNVAGDYVAAGGVYPGSRQGGVTWTDPVTGEFWLFGGVGYDSAGTFNVLNDLWMYDGSWHFIGGPTVASDAGTYVAQGSPGWPAARRDGCAWVDRSGQFWLFAGQRQPVFAGTGYLNDLWKYDSGTNTWTWVKGSSTPDVIASVKGASGVLDAANTPNSRSSPGTVSMPDGTLLMFGGISGTTTFYNEIWRWDWVTEQWAWIRGGISAGNYGTKGEGDVARTPGGRFTPSVFAGTNNETLWVFGGGGTAAAANGRLADLWRYDFAPLPQDKYDTDTDGLDDLWEITYFGDTTTVVNGNADADGDGQSNAYEEVSGTNPNNILSLLTSTATIVSGVPYMDYSAVKPNVTYQLSKTSPLPVEVLSRAAFPTAGTGRVLDTTRKLLSAPTTQTAITDTAP